MIESIVVMPLVLITMLLVVQAGLAYHARQVMATAAQDGAAVGAAADSSPASGVALTNQLVNDAVGGLVDNFSASPSSSGTQFTITATGTATKVFPLFPTISLSASGSATIEQFEAQD